MADPQKDATTTPDPTKGSTPPADYTQLRADWKKLSKADQDKYFSSLSPDEQGEFANRVDLFGQAQNVTAPLKPDVNDFMSNPTPVNAGISLMKSIPWMKEKAYSAAYKFGKALPTIGGTIGGLIGGVVGEVADPAGGGVVAKTVGAGIGGAMGETERQVINHATGYDKSQDAEDKTLGARSRSVGKEFLAQGAGELSGHYLGKWLRPTLDRSIAKLSYAGGLDYGDPLGDGNLRNVMNDLIETEKHTGKAVTVKDFYYTVNQAKKDIGQKVDSQLAIPFTMANGNVTMLGKAPANPTDIANAIAAKATEDPSIIRDARLNPAGKEAAYLEYIRKEALNYAKDIPTYEQLMAKRIRLNGELAPLYELSNPGERRLYRLNNPEISVKEAEANAIRDTIYPQMDRLSNMPPGTTAAMQNKRGALMRIETQLLDHLSDLKTKTLKQKGAPLAEQVNGSGYITSSGKPGGAIHRVTRIFHTPNPEARADRQVSRAFGHGLQTNARRVVTTPFGSPQLGNELLSLPLRTILNNNQNKHEEDKMKKDDNDDTTPGPQSSATRPKDLIERAKKLNPAAQGQVAYTHTAVNPANGHRIGSRDGKTWYDEKTGAVFNG